MLEQKQINALQEHLIDISRFVPYKYGRKQIKQLDRKLPFYFDYDTYHDLNDAIDAHAKRGYITTTDEENNYYRYNIAGAIQRNTRQARPVRHLLPKPDGR